MIQALLDTDTLSLFHKRHPNHDEAYVGALAVVIAIREGLNGNWQGESGLLPIVIDHIPDSGVRDRLIELTKVNDSVSLTAVCA